jgi:hypothetical protein
MTDQKSTKDDDVRSDQIGQPSRKQPKAPKLRKVERRRKGRKG